MGEFIRSAFGYFGSSSASNRENELVGQTIEVGKQNFRIRRVIAEGGYAIVFEGYESETGKSVAIKRLLAHDMETSKNVLNEIDVLKKLTGHPNIIRFFSAASLGKEKLKHIGTEFLIVTEFCSGGSLLEFLPKSRQEQPLLLGLVLAILAQTSRAVEHMHKQSPPIIHRDLKVENLLLSSNYTIKLCDFGSASTQTYAPTISWSANERGRVQEDLEKMTTPMYRAPEMLDLYLNYPINEALDIWALGCIFFYLVCGYHPFEDSAKLAILNANFNLPVCDEEAEPFHNLIRQMLLVDPDQRPKISTIVGELTELASLRNVSISDPIIFNEDVRRRLRVSGSKVPVSVSTAVDSPRIQNLPLRVSNPSPRSTPISNLVPPTEEVDTSGELSFSKNSFHQHLHRRHRSQLNTAMNSEVGSAPTASMIGFLKGSAGHLMKNLRDASSKVMETVNAAMPSELDLQFITSRIAVMSYPAESGFEVFGSRNSMEEANSYLDKHHANAYAVYNLSSRAYRSEHWFNGRVSHRPFEAHCSPSLWSLVELCQNARLWLAQNQNNICVIHCTDGRQISAVFVCCLLCFCNVFKNATDSLDFFISKRGLVSLNASQMRYIDYISSLVASPPNPPHNHPLLLFSITLAPVPTFNRLKNGCRPYVEVYQNGKQIYSTMTDYSSLRTYVLEDRKIELILNGISVYGDVTISLFHSRSLFAGKGKAAALKICQIQFHTGFVNREVEKLTFTKSQLDHLDSTSSFAGFSSRYAESFHASLHLMCSPHEKPRSGSSLVFPWETLPLPSARHPGLCFKINSEVKSVVKDFADKVSEDSARMSSSFHTDNRNEKSTFEPSAPILVIENSGVINYENDEELISPDTESPRNIKKIHPSTPPPNSPTHTDVLIEGLDWSQAPAFPISEYKGDTESESQATKEKIPSIADLLGFSSDINVSNFPLPDINRASVNSESSPDMPPLLGDLINSSNLSPVPWDDPWQSLSQPADKRNEASVINKNPFDPLGTATYPPESIPCETCFDPYSSADRKSDSIIQPNQAFIHTSSSTSNLTNVGENEIERNQIPQSVSSSNLTSEKNELKFEPNNNTNHQTLKNPFDAFDALFEDAVNSVRTGSPLQSPVHKSNVCSGSNVPPSTTSSSHNRYFADYPFHGSTAFSTFSSNQFPRGHPSMHTNPPVGNSTQTSYRDTFSPPNSRTGTHPHVSKDAFADLLGGFGAGTESSSFGAQEPKSMKEMRRVKLAQTADPESLKILEWVEGKEKNVRALLCTLSSVLWEGVRWSQISMVDVMTVNQVKRQYRNAARAVHPDKWMNTGHENMARLILIELNDSMAEFDRIEQSGC